MRWTWWRADETRVRLAAEVHGEHGRFPLPGGTGAVRLDDDRL
jgi:hypothetical protein